MNADVTAHLASVQSPVRRRDADTLIDLMQRVTGQEPRMWSSIVGFGEYHYRYASGREGDAPAAGFAPRKAATTVYVLDGVDGYRDLLDRLGPHTTGVGCIYIKDLDKVDLDALESIVRGSYERLTAGVWPSRAAESG
ncbi:MAG TPA: DUF1801 domain-containing protein [Intrasporangium sp.]|uniref:DUF1801 domain-containing protein n=1 Tax=Intrasporangium sp. TaxID=1925024 RepID=UPI002B46CF2C|nr:DUF1801 domain-containing protein [Intrasporangium sp.]HKX65929.1 DUF1801 domain-containing protein [Intrasporangium sp.]